MGYSPILLNTNMSSCYRLKQLNDQLEFEKQSVISTERQRVEK